MVFVQWIIEDFLKTDLWQKGFFSPRFWWRCCFIKIFTCLGLALESPRLYVCNPVSLKTHDIQFKIVKHGCLFRIDGGGVFKNGSGKVSHTPGYCIRYRSPTLFLERGWMKFCLYESFPFWPKELLYFSRSTILVPELESLNNFYFSPHKPKWSRNSIHRSGGDLLRRDVFVWIRKILSFHPKYPQANRRSPKWQTFGICHWMWYEGI